MWGLNRWQTTWGWARLVWRLCTCLGERSEGIPFSDALTTKNILPMGQLPRALTIKNIPIYQFTRSLPGQNSVLKFLHKRVFLMVNRAIYAGIALLVLYSISALLLPLPQVVWAIAAVIAVLYIFVGDRV